MSQKGIGKLQYFCFLNVFVMAVFSFACQLSINININNLVKGECFELIQKTLGVFIVKKMPRTTTHLSEIF